MKMFDLKKKFLKIMCFNKIDLNNNETKALSKKSSKRLSKRLSKREYIKREKYRDKYENLLDKQGIGEYKEAQFIKWYAKQLKERVKL